MFLLFKAIIYLPSAKSLKSFSDIALRTLTRVPPWTCLLTHHPHSKTSFLTNSKANISKTAWINPLSGFYFRIFPLLKVNARMLSQGTKIIFRKVFCFPTKKSTILDGRATTTPRHWLCVFIILFSYSVASPSWNQSPPQVIWFLIRYSINMIFN